MGTSLADVTRNVPGPQRFEELDPKRQALIRANLATLDEKGATEDQIRSYLQDDEHLMPVGQHEGKPQQPGSEHHGASADFTTIGDTGGPAGFGEAMLEGLPFGTKTKALIDATASKVTGGPFDYSARMGARKQAMAQYREQHPIKSFLANLIGGAAPAIATGGASEGPVAIGGAARQTLGKRILSAAGQGVDYGAIQGLSQASGSPEDYVREIETNAALGGILGPLVGMPVAKFAGWASGKLAPAVSRGAQAISDRTGWKAPARLASSIGPRGRAATDIGEQIINDRKAGVELQAPNLPPNANRALNQGGPNVVEHAAQVAKESGPGRAVLEKSLNEQRQQLDPSMQNAIEAATGVEPGTGVNQLRGDLDAQVAEARQNYDAARAASEGAPAMSPAFDRSRRTAAGQVADQYARSRMTDFFRSYAPLKIQGPLQMPPAEPPVAPETPPAGPPAGPPAETAPPAAAAKPAQPSGSILDQVLGATEAGKAAEPGQELSDEAKNAIRQATPQYERQLGRRLEELPPNVKEAFYDQLRKAVEEAGRDWFKPARAAGRRVPLGSVPGTGAPDFEAPPGGAAGAPPPDLTDPANYQEIRVPTPEYVHFYKIKLNRLAKGLDEAGMRGDVATSAAGAAQQAAQIADELPPQWREADAAYARARRLLDARQRGLGTYNTPDIPKNANPRRSVENSLSELENDARTETPANREAIQQGAGSAMQSRWEGRPPGRVSPGKSFPPTGTTARRTRIAMRPEMGPQELPPGAQGPKIEPTPEQGFNRTVAGWDRAAEDYQRVLGGSPTAKRVGPRLSSSLGAPGTIMDILAGRIRHPIRGAMNQAASEAQRRAQGIIDHEASKILASREPDALQNAEQSAQTRQKLITLIERLFPALAGGEAALVRSHNRDEKLLPWEQR